MGLMPTYMENDGVLSTKLVCFYDRKKGSSLPATQATVVLLDPEYGNVKAVSKTNACTDYSDTTATRMACFQHSNLSLNLYIRGTLCPVHMAALINKIDLT